MKVDVKVDERGELMVDLMVWKKALTWVVLMDLR